jgi:threonine dehydratase
MLPVHEQVPLERIYDARARLAGEVLRTPLVHLDAEDGGIEIYLKLEICSRSARSSSVVP